MESLGASCCNIYEAQTITADKDVELKEIITSTVSLSNYERKNFKSVWPQTIAAIIAAAFHLGNGISLAYSAILIKQLEHPDSPLKSTKSENSWIASVLIVVAPVASLIGGVFIDYFGRLNTIKIAGIPGTLGWCLIAVSQNIPTIIVGRALVGIASAWGTNPAMVYITEIAHKDIRGSLMCVGPIYVALGMVLTYWGGWMIDWRMLAWICNIFVIVPCVLCQLVPESPAWLVLKGRTEAARKSLIWLNKYQPQPPNKSSSLAEMKLKQLEEEMRKKQEENQAKSSGIREIAKEFLKPTGYKPLVLLIGMFFFQHFSGIYITMFYSISFIEAAGATMDGYLASIMIGLVRLVMSVIVTYLFKTFNRRMLLFSSATGMAVFMLLSGLYTKWIQEGTTTVTWMPVACILLYVVMSTVGMLPIPLMLIAELYPLEIRGMAYSLTYGLNCVLMFAALQSYYTLNDFVGGAAHLQWFFAAICCGGLVYSYIFIPETKGRKLTDINNYFKENIMYIGHSNNNNNNNVKASPEEQEKLNGTNGR